MDETINGDLSAVARADTASMAWTASPSGTVHRKRVHLVGPPEAGQVTSVVRYEPDARFPAHDHPDGEEILVLGGVFSDEHGDWPAGTYLLNPEGFRHAPFSKEGCTIFVKLRQYAGTDRPHVVLDTTAEPWQASDEAGVETLPLYAQDGHPDAMRLERWAPGTRLAERRYDAGAELFVVSGRFDDEHGSHGPGSWLRLPAGGAHTPRSDEGCTVYRKTGGLGALHGAAG